MNEINDDLINIGTKEELTQRISIVHGGKVPRKYEYLFDEFDKIKKESKEEEEEEEDKKEKKELDDEQKKLIKKTINKKRTIRNIIPKAVEILKKLKPKPKRKKNKILILFISAI